MSGHELGEFGQVDEVAIGQHEWYSALRRAGFTRCEALYVVTRSLVETTRLEWVARRPDDGQPQ